MNRKQIHLGYEVGSGTAVSIPLDHMMITGRTQAAGKTTTLEALVHRSKLRCLSFLTKPGEKLFADSHPTEPYFYDQGGWQFVASILESALGEKLKQERAEIINASAGAKSLREVYQRIVDKKARAKSGWVIDVLTRLEAYLDIVLPQIEQIRFAKKLKISRGVNVIDLSQGFSSEMQSLIIRSSIEWILANEKDVITVIPEAWKFLPNGAGNPVLHGCRTLIRQGGTLGNWVAIDSQEITSVDAGIRKSIGVWICGVQQELNEVKRVIDQLPGKPKPAPDDVMTLGLGQFYISFPSPSGGVTWPRKVYVQPLWMEDNQAFMIATNGMPPILSKYEGEPGRVVVEPDPERELTGSDFDQAIVDDVDLSWRETSNLEEDEVDTTNLERKLDLILEELRSHAAPVHNHVPVERPKAFEPGEIDKEPLYAEFRSRLLKDPVVLKVLATQPRIEVETQLQTIQYDGSSLKGRIALLVKNGFFDNGVSSAGVVRRELKRTGGDSPENNIMPVLKEYQKYGFLTLEQDGGWHSVTEMKRHIVAKAGK